jgi:hypothetical protein
VNGLDRYRYFDLESLLQQTPYLNLPGFNEFLNDSKKRPILYPLITQMRTSEFEMSTPHDQFNRLLAAKNHQRTVHYAKKIFGDQYKDRKYFLLSALSDCPNFYELLPKNSKYSDAYVSRRSYETLQQVLVRVGLDVMTPRVIKAESFFKSYNMVRQLEVVWKVYFGFLGEDKDEEVKDFNLNPIKMSMHPAWGANEIAVEFLMDPDFSGLRQVDGVSTEDILRVRNALPPKGHYPQWSKWLEASNLSQSEEMVDPLFQSLFSKKMDEIEYGDALFNKYCQKIYEAYRSRE